MKTPPVLPKTSHLPEWKARAEKAKYYFDLELYENAQVVSAMAAALSCPEGAEQDLFLARAIASERAANKARRSRLSFEMTPPRSYYCYV